MSSKLDLGQILRGAYDEASQALKTVPGSSTSFSIELDAADGDSISAHRRQLAAKSSHTSANTGTIVAAFDTAGLNFINLHSNTTTTIVDAQLLTLQFSPHSSDNVWINTSITLTPSATSGTIVSGTQIANLNAVRCRVITAAAITSGAYDLYIVGN
jgi:hypothetical protein